MSDNNNLGIPENNFLLVIGKNLTGLKYLVLLCRDPEVHLIYTTRESMYLDNQSGLFRGVCTISSAHNVKRCATGE
jgi:hypothetical protein